MAINKVYSSPEKAVADIPDNSILMLGGWGTLIDTPQNLILALAKQGAKGLTVICNLLGQADVRSHLKGKKWFDGYVLVANRQVKKVICSVPFGARPGVQGIVYQRYMAKEFEIERVPQGTLAERIRAGGYGIGGFYTRTGVGTIIGQGKETRFFNGEEYLLESPLKADYALIRAYKADRFGNLIYRKAMRTFNPVMATAARITIVEVDQIVELGELDPDVIVTPGVYVDRIVETRGEIIVQHDTVT